MLEREHAWTKFQLGPTETVLLSEVEYNTQSLYQHDTGGSWPLLQLIGAPFSDLDNPFEPIIDLYLSGYCPVSWNLERWSIFLRCADPG